MPKKLHYDSRQFSSGLTGDPYAWPAFSVGNKLRRLVWNVFWLLFYRSSPRPMHRWRAGCLRIFGAEVGPNCHFYPGSRIHSPWNLVCEDGVAAGDGVEIYNPAPLVLRSHVILSQSSYVCGATHDYNDPSFPLLAFEMEIGAYAWICSRAVVAPGIAVGEGAVLGLGSVATKSLEPWTVYAGNPAIRIKSRERMNLSAR